jgi:hypothetical protein
VDGIARLWRSHAELYGPSIFGLILCGSNHPADDLVYSYVRHHRDQLDDMAGPYTSLAIIVAKSDAAITGNAGPTATEAMPPELGYLHATTLWELDADGVYSVAHALRLRLDGMPFIVLSSQPTTSGGYWALSVRDALADLLGQDPETDRPKSSNSAAAAQVARLFEVLLTEGREAYDRPPEKRLKVLQKAVEREFRGRSRWSFSRLAESGVMAQIIEGIVKGLS